MDTMTKVVLCSLVFAIALGTFGSDDSVWSSSLTDSANQAEIKLNNHKKNQHFRLTAEGFEWRDNGKEFPHGIEADITIPPEIEKRLEKLDLIREFEVKTENFAGQGSFAFRANNGGIWSEYKIPEGTYGWKKVSVPLGINFSIKKAQIIFYVNGKSKGKIVIRNLKFMQNDLPIDITPFGNISYKDSDKKNGWAALGPRKDASDFAKQRLETRWTKLPMKISSTKAVRLQSAVLSGAEHLTIPLSDFFISAKYFYISHILVNGSPDFQGKIEFVGKNGKRFDQPVRFGKEIKDWMDFRNLNNASNLIFYTVGWSERGVMAVSRFEIPANIGLLKEIVITGNPNSKAVYFITGAGLSNRKCELPKGEIYSIQECREWKTFPFPEQAGILPGSALDCASSPGPVKRTEPVIINKDGKFAFASNPSKAIRFLSHNSMDFYWLNKPRIEQKLQRALKRDPNFFTEYVYGPVKGDPKKQIEMFVRELRHRGYNLVRMCGDGTGGWMLMKGGLNFDPVDFDNLMYYFKCLKDNGIYVLWDIGIPFYWGEPWTSQNAKEKGWAKNRIYYEDAVKKNWKAGVTKLLTTKNPYTGIALKDDPVIIGILGWNESEIMTLGTGVVAKMFQTFFQKKMKEKYGNIQALKKAWKKENAPWKDFSDLPHPDAYRNPQIPDMELFLLELEENQLAWYRKTLREIGYKGPVSNFNFLGNFHWTILRDKADYVSFNQYHGHPSNFISCESMIGNKSCIGTMNNYFRNGYAATKHAGKPYLITEGECVFWDAYRYEQAFVMDAYSALIGIDGINMFASISAEVRSDRNDGEFRIKPFFGRFDPIKHGSEFLAYHIFKTGGVRTSETSVRLDLDRNEILKAGQNYHLPSTEQNMLSLVCRFSVAMADYEKNVKRPLGKNEISIRRAGGIRGKRHEFYSEGFDELGKFDTMSLIRNMKEKGLLPKNNRTDTQKGIFESSTGELYMDSKRHLGLISTPALQAVFAEAGTSHRFPDFEVRKMSVRGALAAVAVDGRKLADSNRVVVVFLTDALNKGMTFVNSEMKRLLKIGDGKGILSRTGAFQIALDNKNMKHWKAYALDLNGKRVEEIPLTRENRKNVLSVDTANLKTGPAIYFELIQEK